MNLKILTVLLSLACSSSAHEEELLSLTQRIIGGEETTTTSSSSLTAKEISKLTAEVKTVLNYQKISKILPNSYPFLLVDRVVEYNKEDKEAVGIKLVTANEFQITGHFPDRPIFPGVLQLEALAQLAAIVCLQIDGKDHYGAVFSLDEVEDVKWGKRVNIGDILVMEVEIEKWKEKNDKTWECEASGKAYVNGKHVIEVDDMILRVNV
mmetsp:Transcript_11945/g.17916  ORF Transcript_11945/g.17916 Transcript_11945/m.17916 type:complete len:209 (+) Transcript_11945:299-925(+)